MYIWFWWRGTCSQAFILVEGYCYLRGTDILVNGFSAFLSMRRWKNQMHNIFSWKYLTIWGPVLSVFLKHKEGTYLCLEFFSGWQWFDSCRIQWWTMFFILQSFFFNLNFNQGLEGTSWPICPTTLRMLILRSGMDFVDRPLNVLLLD